MGSRVEVEVTVGTGHDLKNVNWRNGNLKPYAVLWVDSAAKSSTKVDSDNDTNPVWDEKLTIRFPAELTIHDAVLSIEVLHFDPPEGTKPLVGSARLPLKEIVDESGFGNKVFRKLKLKRPSGRPQGKLRVEVSVKELSYYLHPYAQPYGHPYAAAPPPPTAGYPYGAPPPQPAAGYAYGAPPLQPLVGHPYGLPPPQQPVGYPYGAPPPVYGQQESGPPPPAPLKKKSNSGLGMGLAVGTAAGLVGGLVLAEGVDHLENNIAEDVEEKVKDDIDYDD